MGGSNSKAKVSTATASKANPRRQRIAQNFLLVWVDSNIDQSKQDCQHTLTQLRTIVNDIHIFTQSNECIQFLKEIEDEKVFLIASGSLGQQLVPDIHALVQVDAIYIFCANQFRHKQWTRKWVKIKGVYTDIQHLCESLRVAAKRCNEDSIVLSFVAENEKASGGNLNQLEPSFMYTQIFTEILLEMDHDEQSIQQLAEYCRKFYDANKKELSIIDEFACKYRSKSAIWWYTRECFTYNMLNRALRTLETDTIINMGFFIRDLHQEIQQLHRNQIEKYHGKPFIVYRGQGLSKIDFKKLQETKDGLISFNNFLSTSQKRDISLVFAKYALAKTDMVGILFKMSIVPTVSSTAFASIQKFSYFNTEKEVLFSMHTIFRIGEIVSLDQKGTLYQVNLELTADDDQQLRTLSERIRREVVGETGWKRLGRLLIKLNHFDKAEELYNVLLEQTNDKGEKAIYYNLLGYIKDAQGDYTKAILHYENARKIKEKLLPPNHPSLATSYNNIAGVFFNIGEYSKALSSYEKALQIRQKSLSPDHPDLATTYNNIGLVYYHMSDYCKALAFYEKALVIKEKTLPANHSSLATAYNNIAGMYYKMKNYPKALSFYEKDLGICQKTLPPTHLDMAAPYNNIGLVYKSMGEYDKALSLYFKALEIYKKTLPSNHSLLATAYNNIGMLFMDMGQYSKALSYLEHALQIFQSSLPLDHPSIQTTQQNIASLKGKL